MRLLLVEDDDLLGSAIKRSLMSVGYAVDWVRTGSHFNDSVATHSYGLIVMDLGLPGTSGEDLLRNLRAKSGSQPVIIITARGATQDRVLLLDLGADDYLIKPFDLDELNARIRSVLRRSPAHGGPETTLRHGPLQLFPNRRAATWNDKPLSLTQREFCVLDTLLRKRNHVLSRAQLEEALYGWGEEVDSNAIEVYIHYLRRKLGSHVIQTVRGVGYQLAPLRDNA